MPRASDADRWSYLRHLAERSLSGRVRVGRREPTVRRERRSARKRSGEDLVRRLARRIDGRRGIERRPAASGRRAGRSRRRPALVSLRGAGIVVAGNGLGLVVRVSGIMSGILPHWLEGYFGVESSAAGEGTVWRLDHSWSWNPAVTLLFVLLAIALVVAIYSFEIGKAGRLLRAFLISLRLLAIGLVMAMIAQWVLKLNPTQLPYLVVMVDDSESMRITDHYANEKLRAEIERRIKQVGLNEITRLNQAKTLLLENDAAVLRAFDQRYKLKVFFCSELARPQSGDLGGVAKSDSRARTDRQSDPAGRQSAGGAERSRADRYRGRCAADRRHHDRWRAAGRLAGRGGEAIGRPRHQEGAADFARAKGIPLYVIGLGSEEPLKDIELSDLRVPDVTFVDDVLSVPVQCVAARVRRPRDRGPPQGQRIGRRAGEGKSEDRRRRQAAADDAHLSTRQSRRLRFRRRDRHAYRTKSASTTTGSSGK